MKKNNFIIIFLMLSINVFAQNTATINLDSLYGKFNSLFNKENNSSLLYENRESDVNKCLFGLINTLKLNIKYFTGHTAERLSKVLSRPITDTSVITPSGIFRIHYDTTGEATPKYDLNLLAEALDSSFNYEVNFLGYPPPPSDNNAGGDDKYDVYIVNLGSGKFATYGFTEIDSELVSGSNRFTSYIVMDDDYLNYFTSGINGARVTAAHEFHHAIQVGNYIFRSSDLYFYELTSTSMEELVFDSINDYYQYLNNYFNKSNVSFSLTQGYDIAVWNLYLFNKYGTDIVKRQWELMPSNIALETINKSLLELNSTFELDLKEFGLWIYFTGYRAVTGRFFKEAANYPVVKPVSVLNFTPPEKNVDINSQPLANTYILFINSGSTASNTDTLAVVITNSDLPSAVANPVQTLTATYNLSNSSASGGQRLIDNYYSKLSSSKPTVWSKAEILNNQIIQEGISGKQIIDFAFPSPFSYSKYNFLFLPVEIKTLSSKVNLNIYSASMELVYNADLDAFLISGQTVVKWNGLNNSGEKLPTGVYVFAARSGELFKKGKIVIFNE